jgi:quinoprotein glucose dehydrogenase
MRRTGSPLFLFSPCWGFLPLCLAALTSGKAADRDWPTVGGDKGGSRYSTLDQINRRNVTNLRVAWTYHAGDAGNGTTIECTPLVVNGVMFVTTVATKVVALDADTGA